MRFATILLLGLMAISAFAQTSQSPNVCEGTDWYHLTPEEIAAEVASGDLGFMDDINASLPASPCSVSPISVVAQKLCRGISNNLKAEWSAKAQYRCGSTVKNKVVYNTQNVFFKGDFDIVD